MRSSTVAACISFVALNGCASDPTGSGPGAGSGTASTSGIPNFANEADIHPITAPQPQDITAFDALAPEGLPDQATALLLESSLGRIPGQLSIQIIEYKDSTLGWNNAVIVTAGAFVPVDLEGGAYAITLVADLLPEEISQVFSGEEQQSETGVNGYAAGIQRVGARVSRLPTSIRFVVGPAGFLLISAKTKLLDVAPVAEGVTVDPSLEPETTWIAVKGVPTIHCSAWHEGGDIGGSEGGVMAAASRPDPNFESQFCRKNVLETPLAAFVDR